MRLTLVAVHVNGRSSARRGNELFPQSYNVIWYEADCADIDAVTCQINLLVRSP